mmetsp:Transcript_43693/g.123722  ORF Transcript_43693/g.123722 Transcript_43693/m.123722 type:complete len:301 (-) Transcript_43693:1052-1954(-)
MLQARPRRAVPGLHEDHDDLLLHPVAKPPRLLLLALDWPLGLRPLHRDQHDAIGWRLRLPANVLLVRERRHRRRVDHVSDHLARARDHDRLHPLRAHPCQYPGIASVGVAPGPPALGSGAERKHVQVEAVLLPEQCQGGDGHADPGEGHGAAVGGEEALGQGRPGARVGPAGDAQHAQDGSLRPEDSTSLLHPLLQLADRVVQVGARGLLLHGDVQRGPRPRPRGLPREGRGEGCLLPELGGVRLCPGGHRQQVDETAPNDEVQQGHLRDLGARAAGGGGHMDQRRRAVGALEALRAARG